MNKETKARIAKGAPVEIDYSIKHCREANRVLTKLAEIIYDFLERLERYQKESDLVSCICAAINEARDNLGDAVNVLRWAKKRLGELNDD